MWEWFVPRDERSYYKINIMEGTGGGGVTPPTTIAWLWGFLFGVIATVAFSVIYTYWPT